MGCIISEVPLRQVLGIEEIWRGGDSSASTCQSPSSASSPQALSSLHTCNRLAPFTSAAAPSPRLQFQLGTFQNLLGSESPVPVSLSSTPPFQLPPLCEQMIFQRVPYDLIVPARKTLSWCTPPTLSVDAPCGIQGLSQAVPRGPSGSRFPVASFGPAPSFFPLPRHTCFFTNKPRCQNFLSHLTYLENPASFSASSASKDPFLFSF